MLDPVLNPIPFLFAGFPNRVLTEEGLELTFATNYFGHFLLTNLLLGKSVVDNEIWIRFLLHSYLFLRFIPLTLKVNILTHIDTLIIT